MANKKIKLCLVCKTPFKARKDAKTCSPACRKKLQRGLKAQAAEKANRLQTTLGEEFHRLAAELMKQHVWQVPLTDERGAIPVTSGDEASDSQASPQQAPPTVQPNAPEVSSLELADDSLEAPSTPVEAPSIGQPEPEVTKPRRPHLFRFNWTAVIGTAVAVVLLAVIGGTGYLLTGKNQSGKKSTGADQKISSYAIGNLKVKSLDAEQALQLTGVSRLDLNGELRVSNSVVLVPGTAPGDPTTGQIYYNRATNQPYYYNGTTYVSLKPQSLPGHVSSLGGQTGDIALGVGLSLSNEGQLGVVYGATAGTAVQGNTSLTCASGTGNLTGGGNIITLGAGGSCENITITDSPTFAGPVAVQGSGGLTVGVAGTTSGVLNLANASNTNLSAIQALAPTGTGTATFNLPSIAGGSSDTICLVNLGNCAGSGSGVTTTGGTQNYITKYNNGGASQISNSQLYDNGSFVGLNTTTNSGQLSVVAAGTQTGLYLQGAASGTSPVAVIRGGGSTGNLFQVQTSTPATVLSVSSTGAVLAQNSVDSTAAFQIQNAAGTSNLLVADTTNTKIGIGLAPSASGATLQVSGSLSTTSSASFGSNVSILSSSATSGGFIKTFTAGGTVAANDVLVYNSSGNVADTTTARDTKVAGIANNSQTVGNGVGVIISGNATVNVDTGAVNVGDQLVTSTTAGQATVDNNATTGIIGIALTSKAAGSAGTVGVAVNPVGGQSNPYFRPTTDSTNAFRISNANTSVNLLVADTVNGKLGLGASPSASGAFLQVQSTASFSGSGNGSTTVGTLFKNGTDSTTAFQIQNAAGTSNLFVADTTNTRIGIGALPANGLLTVGTNTTSSAGGIYFGTDTALYRSNAFTLTTNGDYRAIGNIYANSGTANQVYLGNSSSQASISFGSAFDVGLYRTGAGSLKLQGTTDSTTTFQIQNAAGAPQLIADTTNNQLTVNSSLTIGSQGTPTFTDGFESGSVATNWTNTGMTIDSAAHTGSFAAVATNQQYAIRGITATNVLDMKAYVYINSMTSGSLDMMLFNGGGSTRLSLYRNSATGFLNVFNSNTAGNLSGATVMTTGAWHLIEMRSTSGTSGQVQVYLDGNLTINANTNVGANTFTQVQIGEPNANTGTAHYDDVAVGPYGSLAVNENSSFYGTVLAQNVSDSTTAFQIQNAAGTSNLLVADTTNNNIGISMTPNSSGARFQVNGGIAVTTNVGTSATGNNAFYLNSAGSNYGFIENTAANTWALGYGTNVSTLGTAALTWNSSGNVTVANNFTDNGAGLFKNATNSTTAFQIQNASGSTLFNVDTTTANLISNPSFEVNTTGWSPKGTGTPTLTRITTQQYIGSAALQIATTANTFNGAYFQYPLAGSTPYAFSVYAKASGSNFSTFDLGYSNDGSSNTGCLTSQTVTTSGWTRYTCTFTTGATTASSYVYVDASDATARTFYIDAAQLTQTASNSPYKEGTLALNGVVNSPVNFQNASDSTTAFQIQNAAATSNLFIADTVNNRIGINKVPTTALDVQGNIQGSGNVSAGNNLYVNSGTTQLQIGGFGPSSQAAVGFGSTLDAIIYRAAAGQLVVKPGSGNDSTAAFQIQNAAGTNPVFNADTTNGRVGIGTSAPGTALDVRGNINVQNSSTTALVVQSSGFTKVLTVDTTNSQVGINQTPTGSASLQATDSVNNDFVGILKQTNAIGSNGLQIITQTTASTDSALDIKSNAGSNSILSLRNNGQLGLAGALTPSADLSFGNGSSRTININQEPSGGGDNLNIIAGQSASGATNGGDLVLQGGATGGTGKTGSVVVKANGTDSNIAFEVQNSSSAAALVVSTNNVTAGYNAANATLDVAKDSGTSRSINAAGTINASGADYAEWIPWSGAKPEQGSVVAYQGSNYVVSSPTTAAFIGNDKIDEANAILVTFAGQVPVKVTGSVNAGDVLVANGDGTASAVAPANASLVDYLSKVGIAQEPSSDSGVKLVMAAIGTTASGVSANNLLGNSLNLSTLNVSGAATISDLTVSTLHVTGDLAVDGGLTVKGLASVQDIEVSGHIITSGGQPTANLQAATGAGSSISVSGTDTTGTITITTGSNPTAGDLAKLSFSKVYGVAPHVVLSPSNDAASSLHYFKGSTDASGFMLDSHDTPAANTTYQFDYFIAQ